MINEVPAVQREKAYLARGNAYPDGGDPDHAIGDYNKALELQPRDKEALYARGFSPRKRGNSRAVKFLFKIKSHAHSMARPGEVFRTNKNFVRINQFVTFDQNNRVGVGGE